MMTANTRIKLLMYRAGVGILMPLALLAAPFNRKLRGFFELKLRVRRNLPKLDQPIWIHAASGEFEYAKAVVRELKQRRPDIPILVTYSSPSFQRSIEKFPGVDLALPLPLDLPGPCAGFIKKWRPRCWLISRTDLWPEMIHQARLRKIPLLLFSMTQKDPSRINPLARGLKRWLLSQMNEIHCVSAADLDNLKALGIGHAVISGDTRYDQVHHRLMHGQTLPETLAPSRPCLVAGSTWPEDEKVLLQATSELLRQKRMQMILVPHEPTDAHLAQLQSKLKAHGLKWTLFSEQNDWSKAEVLLVDKTGVLAELYQWGDFAFVGGSFKRTVHSVMEPLGAGLSTLVGPYHTNNREALEFTQIQVGRYKAVQPVGDANQMRAVLEGLLEENPASREKQIIEAFARRLGATRRLTDHLLRVYIGHPASFDPNLSPHS